MMVAIVKNVRYENILSWKMGVVSRESVQNVRNVRILL